MDSQLGYIDDRFPVGYTREGLPVRLVISLGASETFLIFEESILN